MFEHTKNLIKNKQKQFPIKCETCGKVLISSIDKCDVPEEQLKFDFGSYDAEVRLGNPTRVFCSTECLDNLHLLEALSDMSYPSKKDKAQKLINRYNQIYLDQSMKTSD